MKTSKILLAMALPVAFAACSSEEIVENNNVSLQNRELLPALTAVVESSVDSRFSWNEETFGWNKFTADDKFAAGLTDANLWVEGDKMMTNYIFSDAEGKGAYTTTSQMVEGTYFFYSYPGFENVAARQAVPFDLTSQKSVDFKNPAAAVEANQLFVSALYKLDKATANKALPVKFISYWSTAGLKIKNTTGADIKIVRMMVETKGDKMELRGELKPSDLGDVAKEAKDIKGLVYYHNGEDYVLPFDATATTNPSWNDIKTKDIANTTSDVLNSLAEEAMMLTVENGELAEDAEATVYFQMPAGLYKDAKVTLFVEVYDENEEDYVVKMLEPVEFVKNAKSAATATENDRTAFYRGGTTAVFGVEEGAVAAHEIVEYDIINAQVSGAYAASYDDLVAIVKESTETTICNMGELKVDDAVIKLLASTTALKRGEYTFVNPIEISTSKTSTVALKNFTVNSATITNGKFSANYDLEGTVTVNPGAEFELTASQSGAITNKGTVTLNDAVDVQIIDAADATKEISTKVNVNAANTIGHEAPTVANGYRVAEPTDANPDSKVVYLNGMPTTLNLNAKVVSGVKKNTIYTYNTLTVAYGQTVNVDEKVSLTADSKDAITELFKNSGTIVNKGTLDAVTNNGTINTDETAYQTALINNYGVITKLTNGGAEVKNGKALVDQKSETADIKAFVSNAYNGYVNNTIGSFVADEVENVYVEYSGDKTGKIGNVQSVDEIRGTSGTWTDVVFPENSNIRIKLNGVTFTTNKTKEENPNLQLDFEEVEIKNGGATYPVHTYCVNPVLDGSSFTDLQMTGQDGKYPTTISLVNVTVTGDLKIGQTSTLNLAGTTLNNVAGATAISANGVIEYAPVTVINVTPVISKNALGKVNGITAATSVINGDFALGQACTLNIQKHATLKIATDAKLGTEGYKVTINENQEHESDYATGYTHTCTGESKLLVYGTIVK